MKTYELTIEGRPVPKGRPRVTKYGTRTPEKTMKFEKKVLWMFQDKYGRPNLDDKRFNLTVKFFYNDYRTADVDNLAKSVMDALGGNQQSDYRPINDKRVLKLDAQKIVDDDERERTEIELRQV